MKNGYRRIFSPSPVAGDNEWPATRNTSGGRSMSRPYYHMCTSHLLNGPGVTKAPIDYMRMRVLRSVSLYMHLALRTATVLHASWAVRCEHSNGIMPQQVHARYFKQVHTHSVLLDAVIAPAPAAARPAASRSALCWRPCSASQCSRSPGATFCLPSCRSPSICNPS